MEILDSNYIKGETPKVIETKNGFILNGQYYDKATFSPVPFKQFTPSGSAWNLHTNKRVVPSCDAEISTVWNEDTIIADEYQKDIFYVLLKTKSTGIGISILAFKEEENREIKLINGLYDYEVLYDKYLGQDENFLYYSYKYWILKNFNTVRCSVLSIQAVNKKTFEVIAIAEGSQEAWATVPSCIKIWENPSYLYLGLNLNPFNLNLFGFHFVRLVKSTQVIEWPEAINIYPQDTYNFYDNKDVFKIEEDVVGFYLLNLTDLSNPLKLAKVNLNVLFDIGNVATVEDINFSWQTDIKETLEAFPGDYYFSYETFIVKKDSKTFVNIIMYQNSDNVELDYIGLQGIYTFEATDMKSLKLTNYNSITSSVLKGYLISKDRTFLIATTVDSVIFMNFNLDSGAYEIKYIMPVSVASIGFDLSERVWLSKTTGEVELLFANNATNFVMKFENTLYKYDGVDIETFITIEAKNYNDEYVAGLLDLTINGNAKFKDSGNKKIQVSTTESGILTVPIVITGADQIAVYPKFASNI